MSVVINRVYTGTGDAGRTRLAGGQEVPKTSSRIEAYGTVDELNACLGLCVERGLEDAGEGDGPLAELCRRMRRIQNELFDVGGELAVLPADRHEKQILIAKADVERLEAEMDEANAALPALRSFILPGGGMLSALLHQARTVARRAERRIVDLHESEPQREVLLVYVNRVSDWLFVMGRHAARAAGHDEVLWRPGDRS